MTGFFGIAVQRSGCGSRRAEQEKLHTVVQDALHVSLRLSGRGRMKC